MAEFRILGPVGVVHAGAALAVGGPRHRRLLAVLLLHAGRAVPVGTLMEALWGEVPPRTAPAMLHVRASELRAALRVTGAELLARDGGYVLKVDREDIDAWRFERFAAAGAAAMAEGDAERARDALAAGLGLWRGPLLGEFADEPFARSETARLEGLRLQAIEHRVAADLDLGRHGDVVAELEKLVIEYPLREQLWAQLMLALYRSGRQGDALQAYRTARTHLTEELGVEPGHALQALHRSILAGDAGLDAPTVARNVPAAAVPAQLPAAVAAFVGRADELSTLDNSSEVCVIAGTAGVGKTALALHWAHSVRDRFPDGELYVDLRGYDPDLPMQPGEALARFLRALGVADRQLPIDVQERAALYRTLLDGRRLLVVLDNASSADQVRPLLPGTGSCMTLVTSRDALPGLVARHGAHRLDLDLLRRLIGPRVDAEPDAARSLVEMCARLPLALRVTAELAIARSGSRLAHLAAELSDHQRRLQLLDAGGDPRTAVRAVFSWSYQRLPAPAARLFRLLGLHPGADTDPTAAAALAGTDTAAVRPLLDALARAHLIGRAGADRFCMHDLLRAYATDLAGTVDPERERRAARARLLDHYVGMAGSGQRSWLDAERANVTAAIAYAAAHGWHAHATRLAIALWPHLDNAGHYTDAVTMHEHALHAAREAGDRAAEHQLLCNLGQMHSRLGRYPESVSYLEHALAVGRAIGADADGVQAAVLTLLGIVRLWQGDYRRAKAHLHRGRALYRAVGDRLGEGRALGSLGHVHLRQCRYGPAADNLRKAQQIFRECGDRLSEARALGNLAQIAMRLHRFDEAVEHLRRALVLFRETGHRRDEAAAINALGEVYLRQGHHDRALDHHRRALATYREVGDRGNEGIALHGIGDAHLRRGDHGPALDALRQALAVVRQIGDVPREVLVRNTLGEALRGAGEPEAARAEHTGALRQAREIGDRFEQARAHGGLAHLDRDGGDPASARHHYESALAEYTALDLPEAEEMRQHLFTAAGAES